VVATGATGVMTTATVTGSATVATAVMELQMTEEAWDVAGSLAAAKSNVLGSSWVKYDQTAETDNLVTAYQ
jgi:hypothetical protein